jgi:hypothetical protein
MRGRTPLPCHSREPDRQVLQALLADGHLPQRVANSARAPLALDRGERIQAIVYWLGGESCRPLASGATVPAVGGGTNLESFRRPYYEQSIAEHP